jgi:hypothetical protein
MTRHADTTAGDDPVGDARALVAERFPQALAALLAGSALTSRRTPASDLDVVVLLAGASASFRETIRWRGWPVELFVQTHASAQWFWDDETQRRSSPLLHMCAEGRLLVDVDGAGTWLQGQARARLAAGPPVADRATVDRHRYLLTDALDDLAACHDVGERAFVADVVLQSSARLALLHAGRWQGGGKWLYRRLSELDPVLGRRLVAAHREALDDDVTLLLGVVHEILDRVGGPLAEGYYESGNVVGAPATEPDAEPGIAPGE